METNMLRLTDKYDDPVAELRLAANAVRRATLRVFERAVDNGPFGDVARVLIKPRIRRLEDPNTVVVTMEIPGAERESLEVTLSSKDVLCIKGKGVKKARPRAARNSETGPDIRSFERTVPLTGRDLQREKATAYLESGLLTITIPKKEGPKAAAPASTDKPGVRAA
jgi:HSP20 family molecular chaperone IbpA